MSDQSDRIGDFFANEGNPAGVEADSEGQGEPQESNSDSGGMDEPFLANDPDYDPDELYDPDNEPEPEKEPEPEPTPEPDSEVAPEDSTDDTEASSDKDDVLEESSNDDILSEIKELYENPNQGLKWAEIRGENKSLKEENAQLKSGSMTTPEMQEISAKAERVAQVEVALKEAQDKLALFDFQATPEYRNQIEIPYQNIASTASNIEASASIPEGSILKAISAGDKATQDANIQNLVDSYNISPRDVNTIFNKADEMLNLTHFESNLRSTAQERLSESRAQQEARDAYMSEQAQSVYRDHVNNSFSEYEGQIGAFLNEDGTNNEDWSKAISDSHNLDFKNDPEIQGLGAFALTAVPHLMRQNSEFSSEIAKLRALVNRNKAVSPPSVSKTAASPSASPSFNSNMSLSDALGERMKSINI